MVENNKLPDQEDKTSDNHGGKRPGSGRPLGAKTKKIGNLCKRWLKNINILLWIIY